MRLFEHRKTNTEDNALQVGTVEQWVIVSGCTWSVDAFARDRLAAA
jgi:hypothetical protein